MNNEQVLSYFSQHYQAVPADPCRCRAFLENGRQLILGLSFPDPAANFRLLSDSDLTAFPPEAAQKILDEGRSPFRDMLLIFYREDGVTSFKLVNGMAGKLLTLADRFCGLQSD